MYKKLENKLKFSSINNKSIIKYAYCIVDNYECEYNLYYYTSGLSKGFIMVSAKNIDEAIKELYKNLNGPISFNKFQQIMGQELQQVNSEKIRFKDRQGITWVISTSGCIHNHFKTPRWVQFL